MPSPVASRASPGCAREGTGGAAWGGMSLPSPLHLLQETKVQPTAREEPSLLLQGYPASRELGVCPQGPYLWLCCGCLLGGSGCKYGSLSGFLGRAGVTGG